MQISGVFWIEGFECAAVMRMLFAAACGGVIGLEREMKGRPAGLKTFSLVCLGAALAMIANEYISIYVSGGSGDAARMAAQVISGIGFLGAGTIIVTGTNQVRGLTTAAALWVTAAVGIAIGAGFYFGAVAGTAVVYTSSGFFRLLDSILMSRSRYMKLCVEGVTEDFMLQLLAYFSEQKIHVKNFVRRSENKWYKKDVCVMLELDLGKRQKHEKILQDIRQMEGLRFLEEI